MPQISLRAIFVNLVLSIAIGTMITSTVGLRQISNLNAQAREQNEHDLVGKFSSRQDTWIADMLLGYDARIRSEIKTAAPLLTNVSLRLLLPTDISTISDSEALFILGSAGAYRLAISADDNSGINKKRMVFLFAGTLGLMFLGSSILLALLFFKRLTKAISLLDKSIASPLRPIDSSNYAELGEFRLLIDKAFELRDTARRAEKNQALVDLARQVSHDIRSPLSALNLAAGALDLQDERRAIISACSKRINDIAEDLLKKSRTQNGTEIIVLTDLLKEIVQEKNLQFSATQNGELDLFIEIDAGAQIEVEPKGLKRALSNLINNAIESTEQGHHAVILRAKDLNGDIEITIEDRGVGIPTDLLCRLGEEEVTSGKEFGNGLGVFSAKKTIESCRGGRFRIKSHPGVGTQVTISIPRVQNRN
jgi:signal transduction histidine kinase